MEMEDFEYWYGDYRNEPIESDVDDFDSFVEEHDDSMEKNMPRFIVSTRPHESCDCREVFASDGHKATHECVGIHDVGDSSWYVQHIGLEPYAGCGPHCSLVEDWYYDGPSPDVHNVATDDSSD